MSSKKSDKDDSVRIVKKTDYLNKKENLLNDVLKLKKKNSFKNDGILSFAANQERRVDNSFKRFFASNSVPNEARRSLKPVGTRSGIIYGLCKVHKVDESHFDLICPTYIFTFLRC